MCCGQQICVSKKAAYITNNNESFKNGNICLLLIILSMMMIRIKARAVCKIFSSSHASCKQQQHISYAGHSRISSIILVRHTDCSMK